MLIGAAIMINMFLTRFRDALTTITMTTRGSLLSIAECRTHTYTYIYALYTMYIATVYMSVARAFGTSGLREIIVFQIINTVKGEK